MNVQPYLFFNGQCEAALDFYKQALGARVDMLMRMNESPEPHKMPLPAGWDRKVMHASFRIGDALLMASDGMSETQPAFKGFSLSLDAKDKADAERLFTALSAGGTVGMPLSETFWSPCFGMLTDRFGVGWMVGVPGQS